MTTYLHRVADLVIQANIPLPEASSAGAQKAECAFHTMPSGYSAQKPIGEPFHCWNDLSGEPYVWFSFHEFGYHIRFRGIAEFLLSNRAEEIRCYPLPDVPLETIRHLFLDQVLPLVMGRRGRLSLHASAVATSAGVMAFAGKSGLGKSTLAATLAQQNCSVLSDDFLVLKRQGEATMVVPTYPGVRLWPDSLAVLFDNEASTSDVAHYSPKRRVSLNDRENSPVELPLSRIYVLSGADDVWDGGDVGAQVLSPQQAIVELLKYTHVLDVTDRDSLQFVFHQLATLVDAIPCWRLFFPYDYSLLPAVCRVVMAPHDRESPLNASAR
jgi:hypothetical protein